MVKHNDIFVTSKLRANQRGFVHIILYVIVFVILFAALTSLFILRKSHTSLSGLYQSSFGSTAEKAGSDLANGNCSGSGAVTFTHAPMDKADISSIIPYGTMIFQHVTPIDHMYFAPADYHSARDSYNVYAPADAHIVSIQHRTSDYSSFTHGQKTDEYRIILSYSCTFLSYYDLMTSLNSDIKSQIGDKQDVKVNIPVRAGEIIGKIGGQTLDFAVWDTTKVLSGFIVPAHYSGEPWKIYTADPMNYASPSVKAFFLSENPRKVSPISGKIDYDIDGTLSGNWFLKSQGSLTGADQNNHIGWKGDLTFAPNNYDPSLWEISTGAWGENGSQFAISASQPLPNKVTVSTGLVKYDLFQVQLLADGKTNDGNNNPIQGDQTITATAAGQVAGCIVVKLIAQRELKVENFPQKACSTISDLDNKALDYIR